LERQRRARDDGVAEQTGTIYSYHMSGLIKTTVYLTESDYERLKAIARRQNRAAAELVRDAVADYARRRAPRVKPKSLGAGRSGRGDLSEKAEDLLEGMGR